MMNESFSSYRNLVFRLREIAHRTLPSDATVLVVSKGDADLLRLDGQRAWHFPQREDGVYSGYYPEKSGAAIAHLEALHNRGADFLIFPSTAFWWLEHYKEFRQHLESRYRLLVRDEDTCLIFALREPAQGKSAEHQLANLQASGTYTEPVDSQESFPQPGEVEETVASKGLLDYVDDSVADELRLLFDLNYYNAQSGSELSFDEAVTDYFERGGALGYNPHPLFDTRYYLSEHPEVRALGINPLVHFLLHSVAEEHSPSPYFDTEYYYSQDRGLRVNRVNALVHYVINAPDNKAHRPNPLFGNGFYIGVYPDVKNSGENPLGHYLRTGCAEGRFASQTHKNLVETLRQSSKESLLRGNWKVGTVLLFSYGNSAAEAPVMLKAVEILTQCYHLDCQIVLFKRQDWVTELESYAKVVVLEDFQLACDIFRPSAVRLLTKSFSATKPFFALCEAREVLGTLKADGVPLFYIHQHTVDLQPKKVLESVFSQANRVIFNSSQDFHAVAKKLEFYPTNVALRPQEGVSTASYVESLVGLAARESDTLQDVFCPVDERRARKSTRTIVIPCSDWGLSGVNSSLEAVGQELINLGWNVQIVFTRSPSDIILSAGSEANLPRIPFRYLEAHNPGVAEMWKALIADVERNAPCIMFMTYDFSANSIAAALTDKVGVVSWVQADDGDYYEQTYRLGRYCNAVVCVSQHIKQVVTDLNPVIGEKALVIHNSSVREEEIATRKTRSSRILRLIYTGRLVQYQKRVLDFLELATSLDRLDVPYQLTLVGDFSSREGIRDTFEAKAKDHLADGRIRLTGRMAKKEILEELSKHDIFLLLSDFEGLPLALIEAMARGCIPVVAEMESGIPEIIANEENGMIVSGRDYDMWARLLRDLWKNPSRFAGISKSARRTVQESFSVEHTAKQFDAVFGRIVDEVCSGEYRRSPSLNWGDKRSPTGDVLPPPSMYRPPIFNPRGSR
jgi:glycosyltransferase involved in cell wall biosynthesis